MLRPRSRQYACIFTLPASLPSGASRVSSIRGDFPDRPLAVARAAAAAALAALEASRDRIDNLNVYPVPDGDTGTNMALTVRATCDGLDDARCETAADVASAVTRACLMAARGNSGVILSQLVRGAAESLADGRPLDASSLADALRAASDAAYAAVRNPQEGTILTVARELAEHAEELARRDVPLAEALRELVSHGERALARTPEQLDVLRDAGVVDAGGAGLVEIVRGLAAHVSGEPLPEAPPLGAGLPVEAIHRGRSRFRYCTSLFVEGDDVDPDLFERELGQFGDSLLVVGAPGAVKVHVHTDDPGRALALATSVGVIEEVDVKNMHTQAAEREQRLAAAVEPAACEAVAVVAGAGNARLFESLGARVVSGGQTMNPPTSALVAAIDEAVADEVVVLPNNPNVVLTAEQAASAAGSKTAVVIPTHTMQAGLAALVAFDSSRPADENADEMREAAAAVRAGAVTRASRSTVLGDLAIEEGQFLGLVDGEPVATGADLEDVARHVLARLLDDPADVLTILLGDGVRSVEELRRELSVAHPDVEIEIHEGGQPQYPLLFAVE